MDNRSLLQLFSGEGNTWMVFREGVTLYRHRNKHKKIQRVEECARVGEERLVREGLLNKHKITTEHLDPDQILFTIKNADKNVHALAWTPYPEIMDMMGLGMFLDDDKRSNRWEDVVFLMRASFAKQHPNCVRALNIAIRDAWLELIENDEAVEQAANYLMQDLEYMRALRRSIGLYHFEFQV